MNVTTIGIDLAKNVFQVHGVDKAGKTVLRKQLKRSEVAKFFANLPPCLIGMEACGSAHYWARKLETFRHTVKLMAPQFVKPYVKTNKNDARDAEAICEAVQRPHMRFVPVKTLEQQAVLALHRVRQGLVKARTAQANQIRGLLAEFGIVIAQGIRHVPQRVPEILENGENGLPGYARQLFAGLLEHFRELDRRVAEWEKQIVLWHRSHAESLKLEQITGVGPITASALVATVGDAKIFKNGRQLAAWLGLVPRQDSSGGKDRLLGMSKRGDVYLRTLLIHGTRSLLRHLAPTKRCHARLDRAARRSAQPEYCGRRAGKQECPYRVGVTRQRSPLPGRLPDDGDGVGSMKPTDRTFLRGQPLTLGALKKRRPTVKHLAEETPLIAQASSR